MRLALLSLGSVVLTSAVIANAFLQKQQFYPAIVYITKSNPSMAVLYIQASVFVMLLGKIMRKVFFGQLRAAEMEHLIERFWYAVTETCLAFTVFRDDFSPKFVALFSLLLFLKGFHWLSEDRIDYMERSPLITFKFHIRAISLLTFLGTMDSILIDHAFRSTMKSGASVQLVFGFEYAILLTMVVTTLMKYLLHTIDLQRENPWENKTVYLLYTELVTGFFKVVLYCIFVGIMIKVHTFPLFAIRPMYLALRAFKKSLNDVVYSRRAIAYMNSVYPDATTEELVQVDNVCIICRDEMTSGKKLPCNHIFHAHCLRSWFQRQQSCPTCRMDVLSPNALQQQQQQQNQQNTPQPPSSPPQQPQQPNVPNLGFLGMPPVPPFGVWHPMAPPAPAPSPASQTGTASPGEQPSVDTMTPNFPFQPSGLGFPSGVGTVPLSSQVPPGIPPFFMPPFLPPPLFGAPPFIPPANMDLSSLTEEQLKAMEGQERANVEARVKVLRNIHSLLDSALIQMNQYAQAVSSINSMSEATASCNDSKKPGESGVTSSQSKDDKTDISKGSDESQEIKDDVSNDEIRRRRVDKLSNSNEGSLVG